MIFVTLFAGYLLALALIIVGGMIVGLITCIICLVTHISLGDNP